LKLLVTMGSNSHSHSKNQKQPSRRFDRRGGSRVSRARYQMLQSWWGGVDPPSPTRNIHQADEFISQILKSIGVSDGVDADRLKECWHLVAGEFVAKHTVPDSIRNGVLVLRVLQPAMKFHLQQMSGKLLANMRRELGENVVRQIRFTIG